LAGAQAPLFTPFIDEGSPSVLKTFSLVLRSNASEAEAHHVSPNLERGLGIGPRPALLPVLQCPDIDSQVGGEKTARKVQAPAHRGGSALGVAGSAAVILATLFETVGRPPANLHTPVKACPPVGVVRIPTFARAHFASGQWKARGLPRKKTQRTQLLRSFAARMAGGNAYRMVGRIASALLSLVRPRGRFTSALLLLVWLRGRFTP